MLAEKGTRIDWWIISRDTVFIIVYLSFLSGFMKGNEIDYWKPIVLFVLSLIHVLLMKYNSVYEIAIKKAVARNMEVKELKKIVKEDISKFHTNQEMFSRRITYEELRSDVLQFKLKEELVLTTLEDSDLKYLKKQMKERCPELVSDKKR